jgi:hypothetical protein
MKVNWQRGWGAMKRLLYIIIGLLFLISVGCNKSISDDEKTAGWVTLK